MLDCFYPLATQHRLGSPVDGLFDRQMAVLNDPSKRRSIRTTRRAGKTHGSAVDHVQDMCLYPGEDEWSYYITPRLTQSRRNLEGPLNALIRHHQLPIKPKTVDNQLLYEHANGHRLWIAGCKDLSECEKFRGDKARKVKLDEAGAWRPDVLQYLIRECVGPALSDSDGTLDLIGTPGPIPAGYWWEVDTGLGNEQQWSSHSWSVLDNPHHRYYQRPDLLQAVLDRDFGGDPTNPQFLREWRGMWAADLNALCYHYDAAKNRLGPDEAQEDDFFVLGVDFGWHDKCAFTISSSRRGFREIHVRRSYSKGELLIPQMAAEIMRLQQEYPLNRIVGDTGGLGKAICETLIATYGIPIEAADKRDKAVNIRLVGSGLVGGWVKVDPFGCATLLSEWSALAWDAKRLDHSELCADDCSDSALYSLREHPTQEIWEHEPPAPGSPEAINAQMDEYKRKMGERMRREAKKKSRRGRG